VTIMGTSGRDTLHVVRSGSRLHVFDSLPYTSEPAYSFELAMLGGTLTIDLLGGDDSLVVNTGGQPDLGVALVYSARGGANTLVLESGSARIDGTAAGGTLNTTVAAGAHLSTARLSQGELTLAPGSRATLLPGGGTSVLTRLNLGAGATLDIKDNALVIDYASESPVAATREQILAGRGGAGVGKGTWTGTGITSSTAAAANVADPESHSVGYAENAMLPLGPYSMFRGQAVDDTAVLIALARTGDANLDGAVNDDDVTIVGATYSPGMPNPKWALGDFDYNGFVNDEDVTLLGAYYQPVAAAAPPRAVAPLPVVARSPALVVSRSPDRATLSTAGLSPLEFRETFGQEYVRGRETRAQRMRSPEGGRAQQVV
jgi:hypothetical protein